MKAGVHDLTPGVYYADGLGSEISLNATVLKAFIADSPKHGWTQHPRLNPDYEEKTDSKFDVGKAAHALFLQGEDVTEELEVIRDEDGASVRVDVLIKVDGKPFSLIVEANDWRSKAAKAAKADARERGLVPLLSEQWPQTQKLAAIIRERVAGIDADPPLFAAGAAERTLVWRDRGVLCRARLDWLHNSLECADDLKTSARTANPHVWARTTMWSIGADIQAAFTLRGLRLALGVESTFRFVIAETHAPYAISAVTPSEQALTLANAKIDAGLDRWKRCLTDDEWPAFPPKVLTVDPPPWMLMQWDEIQALDEELERAA